MAVDWGHSEVTTTSRQPVKAAPVPSIKVIYCRDRRMSMEPADEHVTAHDGAELHLKPSADVFELIDAVANDLMISREQAAERILYSVTELRRIVLAGSTTRPPAPPVETAAEERPEHSQEPEVKRSERRPWSFEAILIAAATALGIISALIYTFVYRR
jgi:hypothetical protein